MWCLSFLAIWLLEYHLLLPQRCYRGIGIVVAQDNKLFVVQVCWPVWRLFWCWLGSLGSGVCGLLQVHPAACAPSSEELCVFRDRSDAGWSKIVTLGKLEAAQFCFMCLILQHHSLGIFMTKAEKTCESTSQCTSDFHASAYIISANVSVAKAGRMAESRTGEELGPLMPSVYHT